MTPAMEAILPKCANTYAWPVGTIESRGIHDSQERCGVEVAEGTGSKSL